MKEPILNLKEPIWDLREAILGLRGLIWGLLGLISCPKEPDLDLRGRVGDVQTDGWMDGQTDKQTGKFLRDISLLGPLPKRECKKICSNQVEWISDITVLKGLGIFGC